MASENVQPVRGTHDVWIQQQSHVSWIVDVAQAWAQHYGFAEIVTPMIEQAALFEKTSGETSDVVSKEMFMLAARGDGDDRLVLRPEGTAPALRALWSEGLSQTLPAKLFYCGPMFRYNRPQKGRLRQFTQVGVENVGDGSVESDGEIIACAWNFLQELDIEGLEPLSINTLGDQASRDRFRTQLVAFLTPKRGELSLESQARLDTNPLRVLDSKSPQDHAVLSGAPKLSDCLTPEALDRWKGVQAVLKARDIPFKIDHRLVRGLDYYTHTVFEWEYSKAGGAVLAGGRYDGLLDRIGGRDGQTPGIGWAAGVERLALVTEGLEATPPVVLITIGETVALGRTVSTMLREEGHSVDWATHAQNLKAGLKYADRLGALCTLLIGEEEASAQSVRVRNMKTGAQDLIPIRKLSERLDTWLHTDNND